MDHIIHLWGRISSLNVRKAVWAAQELGLDFQRTDAGAAYGVTSTPEYLRKNPNALVPLLEDGDFRNVAEAELESFYYI